MTKQHTAQIGRKRLIDTGSERYYIADVTCPACNELHIVGLAGWSAIVCSGCSAELHKEGTEIEIAAAFRSLLGKRESVWPAYAVAFNAMKQRRVSLKDIQRIALREAGIKPGVVDGRRAGWLAMGGE